MSAPIPALPSGSFVAMFGFILLVSLLPSLLFGAAVTVRLMGEHEGGPYNRALTEEWAQKTGNKVEYFFRPLDSSAALQVYQQY